MIKHLSFAFYGGSLEEAVWTQSIAAKTGGIDSSLWCTVREADIEASISDREEDILAQNWREFVRDKSEEEVCRVSVLGCGFAFHRRAMVKVLESGPDSSDGVTDGDGRGAARRPSGGTAGFGQSSPSSSDLPAILAGLAERRTFGEKGGGFLARVFGIFRDAGGVLDRHLRGMIDCAARHARAVGNMDGLHALLEAFEELIVPTPISTGGVAVIPTGSAPPPHIATERAALPTGASPTLTAAGAPTGAVVLLNNTISTAAVRVTVAPTEAAGATATTALSTAVGEGSPPEEVFEDEARKIVKEWWELYENKTMVLKTYPPTCFSPTDKQVSEKTPLLLMCDARYPENDDPLALAESDAARLADIEEIFYGLDFFPSL